MIDRLSLPMQAALFTFVVLGAGAIPTVIMYAFYKDVRRHCARLGCGRTRSSRCLNARCWRHCARVCQCE